MKTKLLCPIALAFWGIILTGCATPKMGLTYEPQSEYKLKSQHQNQTITISKCIDQRQLKDCDGFSLTNKIDESVCQFVKVALEHYNLFKQVNDGRTSTIAASLTNDLLEIRIKKLASHDPNKSAEVGEGIALGLLSIPGVIIASQLKVTHDQEVEIEFRLVDGGTQEIALNKSYSAARALTFKGADFSLAREADTNLNSCVSETIDDFVIDLSNTQLSGDFHAEQTTNAVITKSP
jgi:hypothetical protein